MHEHDKQTAPPPWQQQGDAMRAALAVNPELQRKIDALQGDLRLRLTDIKLRDQVCPEHLVSCRLHVKCTYTSMLSAPTHALG